jgi:hypothetical protein
LIRRDEVGTFISPISHPRMDAECTSRGLFFVLRAVQDHEMACNVFFRGPEQTNGIAVDLGGDVVEREEPTDLGPKRAIKVCHPPSSLAWSGEGSEQARF